MMTFGDAQEALHQGERIAREGWNGKNLYVALARGVSIAGVGLLCDFYYITSGARRNVWVPSSSDLMASDWCIVAHGALVS